VEIYIKNVFSWERGASVETLGAGVENQEKKTIFVPLSKKDKNKKSNQRWT